MEVKEITDVKAREMSFQELQLEAGKCIKKLELLGMEHVDACKFMTSVMNIGIEFKFRHIAKKKYLN